MTDREMWRKFHYGEKPKRSKVAVWQLLDCGDRIVSGAYSLCVHVMKQRQKAGGNHKFKIVPV